MKFLMLKFCLSKRLLEWSFFEKVLFEEVYNMNKIIWNKMQIEIAIFQIKFQSQKCKPLIYDAKNKWLKTYFIQLISMFLNN
jgi:hypothetical protein